MSGPKHTPGPWRFYQEPMQAGTEWHVITNEHRTRVIANVPVEPGNAMDEANAHLIAAAPRLAAELAAWRAWAERWGRDIETSVSVSPITHNELVERLAATNAALREAGVTDDA